MRVVSFLIYVTYVILLLQQSYRGKRVYFSACYKGYRDTDAARDYLRIPNCGTRHRNPCKGNEETMINLCRWVTRRRDCTRFLNARLL